MQKTHVTDKLNEMVQYVCSSTKNFDKIVGMSWPQELNDENFIKLVMHHNGD